ncbi:hypothetical protein H4S02_000791 [Coemansia sp. RSA 2611]|nr:hypothetical protein H4S02_000791 [Coemansia sp. RSA 2611]
MQSFAEGNIATDGIDPITITQVMLTTVEPDASVEASTATETVTITASAEVITSIITLTAVDLNLALK